MTRRRDPHAATKAVGDVTPTHATRRSGLRPRRLLIFANPIHAATKAVGDVAPTYAIPWARWLSPRKQSRPWGAPTRRTSRINAPTKKPPGITGRFVTALTPILSPRSHNHERKSVGEGKRGCVRLNPGGGQYQK